MGKHKASTTTPTTLSQHHQQRYEKGTRHWVKQLTGLPCLAEIVDTKLSNNNHNNNTCVPEYYIHYCNFDKRLDEWIKEDRFLRPDQVQALGEEYFADTSELSVPLTRNLRRRFSDSFSNIKVEQPTTTTTTTTTNDPLLLQLEREHEEATKVKNIQKITIGCWEIDCWYFSPFPDEYSQCEHLYFCESCLKYMRFQETLARHLPQCKYSGPPGTLIYLADNLIIYELDGQSPSHKLFCQNLCLLAKLFLDHKTIYYDVSPFHFYVLCELSDDKVHPVGFFSKEKNSQDNYNLACIMVLPPYQRKGYGRFLMSLSYELTRREGKSGSPEKPLSDLGLVSYQRFWCREILLKVTNTSTVEVLAKVLGFTVDDVLNGLELMGMLKKNKEGKKVAIQYNSRVVKNLLETKYSLRPGQVDLIPGALSWPSISK